MQEKLGSGSPRPGAGGPVKGLRPGIAVALLAALVLTAGCGRFTARMSLKKGNEFYRDGKYAKAIESYNEIPAGVPERVQGALNTAYANMAQYRFGSSHEKDKQLALDAVKAYEEYIQIRPADADPARNPPVEKIEEYIVTLLADSGRFEDAVARLEQQLQHKPDDPAILRAIAQTYDKWGKPTMALEYFRRWAGRFEKDASPDAAIAAYCWNMSYRQAAGMEPLERNRWIDFGLAAADSALRHDPDQTEAVTYKNLLLRERAKMRIDPDEVALLQKEANVLLERAKELRKKQKEAEAATAAAKASPTPKGAS